MYYDNIQFNLIVSTLTLMKPTHVHEAEMFVCMSVWNKGVWATI